MERDRVGVVKTCKLFIDGGFPRGESGRTEPVRDRTGRTIARVARASRKDVRGAVEAARRAGPAWATRSPYNRGQILYRLAEMIESRRAEFAAALHATDASIDADTAGVEVDASVDRLVAFAGWPDKLHVVFGSNNPVDGPFYNFSAPEPVGTTALVAPDAPGLLGLISLLAPALAAGNAVVLLAAAAHPLAAVLLAEACATSDVPAGVVNVLTGRREDWIESLANHREVDAIVAINAPPNVHRTLELGVAENLKRVHAVAIEDPFDAAACEGPEALSPYVEIKTIWHPASMR